jgi:radical SAM protein with 4Fe4S-binding SPASM domain
MSNIRRGSQINLKKVAGSTAKKIFDTVPEVKKGIARVKRKKLELYPRIVQVETTTACNADCIMCPHSKITRKKGPMDFELYKKVVDDCAENNRFIKTFYPFLNGELFLTPKWENYLIYAKKRLPAAEIGIFTNGSLLDTKNINKLIEIEPDWVNVSFDGTSKETYERIRRKLSFDQVQDNIFQLVGRRNSLRKIKPRLTISIIEMEQTSDGVNSFYKKWAPVVDKVTVEPYVNWGGEAEDEIINKPEVSKRLPCSRLWYNFTVFNSGEVVICCLDYDGEIVIGDIKKQSVREIWTGEEITKLRNLHLEGRYSKISLCEDCSYGQAQTEAPIWWC